MQITNIERFGDTYVIDQLIQFVDNQRSYFDVVKRKMIVTISNHLIESVTMEYNASAQEKAYIDLVNPLAVQFKH